MTEQGILVRKVFQGSSNAYVSIASRGNHIMALGVSYGVHPKSGHGCLVARFVVYNQNGGSEVGQFKVLAKREEAEFLDLNGKPFQGVRLSKFAIPIFHPAPPPLAFLKAYDKYLIGELMTDWVIERAKAEGFSMEDPELDMSPENLRVSIRKLIAMEFDIWDDKMTLVVEFPTFSHVS